MYKRIIALFTFILLVFLTGCSSTYTLKNYPSKQKFYKSYNNFAENKKVKITFLNNKSFYSNNRTEISGDTLYTIVSASIKNNYTIPTISIKKINYLNTGYKEAYILLNNGQRLRAKNISFLKDTISFEGIKTTKVKKALAPISHIKNVSCENHWSGLIPGIPSGMIAGLITGSLGFYSTNSAKTSAAILQPSQTDLPLSIAIGIGIGTLTGGIVGWLIGYNYTYIFNP